MLVIAVLGAASNLSCPFSNYWGTRAIREAGRALTEAWRDIPDVSERSRRRHRMRLYGRDPRSLIDPRRSTPSSKLHPWMLMPALFSLFYLAFPSVINKIAPNDCNLPLLALLTPMLILVVFVVFILRDIPYHARRMVADVCSVDVDEVSLLRYSRALRSWLHSRPDDAAPLPAPTIRRPVPRVTLDE